MQKKKLVKISRLRGLDKYFVLRIYELEEEVRGTKKDGYIEWAFVYSKLCRCFSLHKQEIREIIQQFRKRGFLKISPRGILITSEAGK